MICYRLDFRLDADEIAGQYEIQNLTSSVGEVLVPDRPSFFNNETSFEVRTFHT